jgi:hypothetical protein
LVNELNARFKGALVPSEPPHANDNGFAYYGCGQPLSDFLAF